MLQFREQCKHSVTAFYICMFSKTKRSILLPTWSRASSGLPYTCEVQPLLNSNKKKLLIRCIHHFKSDSCAFWVMNPHPWSLAKQIIKKLKVMFQKYQNKLKPRGLYNKPLKLQFQSILNKVSFDDLKTQRIDRSRP